MNKKETTDLIVGLSLMVGGIFVIWLARRRYNKIMNKISEKELDRMMRSEWENLQKMDFFAQSTPEERTQYFDAFWDTTGGKKK